MEITEKRERKEKQARTNAETIQSISLLAYLAEHHNLWGPFLVIAPASTLHNWQQELARFVPRLKALPYWGSPKDRETLRKIWSRKNMTFSEGSPFHIIVTSYQLVRLRSPFSSLLSFTSSRCSPFFDVRIR
jgi:SNF2 family DNA or RNA helicase